MVIILRIYIIIIISLLISTSSFSKGIDGSLSSDLYIYTDGDNSHVQPYLSLRSKITSWEGNNKQSLSFNSYLRWKSDLQNKLPDDPELFVYNAYFKLTNLPAHSIIHLGRQYIYSSAGSALIDGARIRYNLKRTKIDIYGGSRVNRLDPEKIQSFKDYLTIGGRISVIPVSSIKIGLNWLYKKSDNQISYHRFAIDLRNSYKQCRFYNRFGLNYEKMELAEILSRASYKINDWYFSGEFHYREPSVALNSIFSIINFNQYKIFRFEIRRRLTPKLSLLSQLRYSLYEDDNSIVTALGIQTARYSIIWQHQSGYSGNREGLIGGLPKI